MGCTCGLVEPFRQFRHSTDGWGKTVDDEIVEIDDKIPMDG